MARCANCGREFEPTKQSPKRLSCSRGCARALSKSAAAKQRRGIDTQAKRDQIAQQKRRLWIQKRGRAKGGSVSELQEIAARSEVKVTKLPLGSHTGWKPSWMP